MATLRSTMGAPLNDDEEEAIMSAWAEVLKHADTLISVPRDDQPAQLDAVAEMVGRISSFRSAVHNGWHHANKRAWPAPIPVRRERVRYPKPAPDLSTAQALAILGLTDEDIEDILTKVKGEAK